MHWLIGNFTNWTILIFTPFIFPYYKHYLRLFTPSTFILIKYPMYWLRGVSTSGFQIQSRRHKHRFLHLGAWSSIAHVSIACLDSLVNSTTEHSFMPFSLSVYSQCPSNNTIPISIGLTYLTYVILSISN